MLGGAARRACGSGLWAAAPAGPGPAAAAMWLPPSQANTHHTKTPRSLTWEDEKERQMFGVLLISRVCFSLSCAAFGSVWNGVDSPLLSHPLLSLPQPFDYVRNVAPPQRAFLFLRSSTWFRCAARRGVDFSDFSPLPSCPDIVRAGCCCRL